MNIITFWRKWTMRKDGWNDEKDKILAEIVVDCIKSSRTQLDGFEKASEQLGKTSAACGFRWNSEVRKRYEEEVKEAKSESRKSKKLRGNSVTILNTVSAVEGQQGQIVQLKWSELLYQLKIEFEGLQSANESLNRENMILKERLAEKPLAEDLETLVRIMDRARLLGITEQTTKTS